MKCQICGTALAQSADGLKAHNNRYHGGITPAGNAYLWAAAELTATIVGDGSTGLKGTRKVVPSKRTGRTREQIIQDMEWGIMAFQVACIWPDTRPMKF